MKKITYGLLTILLIISTGCSKDFFDINENPNSPTEEAITPDLILPNVLHNAAKKMATSYDYAAHWTGYWARSGSFGPSNPLENYDLTNVYEKNEWVNGAITGEADPTVSWYNILKDNDVMEKTAEASGQTFYVGIAKVIKSIGFMYLVDQYNNVPYSEAFDLENNITPGYDNGQEIYADLLSQLDEAVKLFAAAEVTNNVRIAEADVMFKGDATKWRKLANTQKLKLLLRQSEILSGAPTAEIAEILADGSGFLMAGETASVNPGYTESQFQRNPFFDTYKTNFSGGSSDDFNRANNYILSKLIGNNDIRYRYYFSAAATPVGGLTYRGYDFGFVDSDPNQPKAGNSSDVAGPGLAKSATQSQWLFTATESLFLQAEAIQRGWLTGNVQSTYEAAVRESFSWLGVTNATTEANNYLTSTAGMFQATVPFIVLQKYYSLVGVNNFEAWVDYRRVGVPSDLPLSESPSRNGRVVPVRLLYPQEEYNFNAANVAAQGTINAQTSKVFWDK